MFFFLCSIRYGTFNVCDLDKCYTANELVWRRESNIKPERIQCLFENIRRTLLVMCVLCAFLFRCLWFFFRSFVSAVVVNLSMQTKNKSFVIGLPIVSNESFNSKHTRARPFYPIDWRKLD